MIKFPVKYMLEQILEHYNENIAPKNGEINIFREMNAFDITLPCRIEYIDDKSKLPPQQGHHVWFENNQLLPLMSHYLPAPYNLSEYNEFQEYLRREPELLSQFADTLIISMPKPRTKHFENSRIEEIRGKVAEYF